MARLPIPGSDANSWGDILNDFLLTSHNSDGTVKPAAISDKANDTDVVHKTGNETVGGVKTFSASPIVPTPVSATDAATKAYVDSVASSGAPDATTSATGLVQLAGDLGGAGTAATAPVISNNAITTSKINDGAVTAAKIAATTITDANISASAAIAKSKLAALNIANSDVASGAAIDQSKLNLAITDAEVASGAAIAQSKVNNLTTDLAGKQPLDSDLTAIAGLTPTNDDVIQRKAGAWTNRSMGQVKTDLALTAGDVGLGNVDNTSDATKNAASVTLTNKTISGSSNTLSNIAQSSVTNLTSDLSTINTTLSGKTDKSTLTTKGDIYVATGASTPARLAVGTDTYVLTADSAQAAGVKWAAPSGGSTSKTLQIKITDDTTSPSIGDGKFVLTISSDLNGTNLTSAHASVSTVSSSGTPTVQIRNITNSNVDMLSTAITIDANENTSYTAAAPPVINTANDNVATGDQVAIDVDVAGTGAKGLAVILTFAP